MGAPGRGRVTEERAKMSDAGSGGDRKVVPTHRQKSGRGRQKSGAYLGKAKGLGNGNGRTSPFTEDETGVEHSFMHAARHRLHFGSRCHDCVIASTQQVQSVKASLIRTTSVSKSFDQKFVCIRANLHASMNLLNGCRY